MTLTIVILLVLITSLILLITAAIKRIHLTEQQTQSTINRIQTYLDKRQNRPPRPADHIVDDLNDSETTLENNEEWD